MSVELYEEDRQLLVYVSGPIRDERGAHYVEENIRKAEAVAKRLWQLGHSVICPHINTRGFDGLIPCDDFIKGDLRQIDACDVIVMLPGWIRSEGAKVELAHAREAGLEVVYWLPALGGGVKEHKLAQAMSVALTEPNFPSYERQQLEDIVTLTA